jgi:hypothetical protein
MAQLRAAAIAAIDGLAAHCGMLPPPKSESDTLSLLDWRRRVFQLATEPIAEASFDAAAGRAVQSIQGQLNNLTRAHESLLKSIESELYDAGQECRAGVIGADAIPANALRQDQGWFFVRKGGGVHDIPDDHPLAQAITYEDLPRDQKIDLGRGRVWHSIDGVRHVQAPAWRLISVLRDECLERRAEEQKQAAELARQRREEEIRKREAKERAKSSEERRIEELERQLAAIQGQLTSKVAECNHVDACAP